MLIMVVEDDEDYAEMVSEVLRRESHEVVCAGTARAALHFAERKRPDLAMLDVMLADGTGTGIDVCRELRMAQPDVPIIFLSCLNRTSDVLAGLAIGADDYISKPFHPSELVARVRAVARRAYPDATPPRSVSKKLSVMGLELDVSNQTAAWNGAHLQLTKTEFELLVELVKYPGQVLSHAFLTEQVWGYTNVDDAGLVKNHISSIRRKLRFGGGDGRMIRTLHGIGYSFVPL